MQGATVFPKSCQIKRKIVFHMIIYLALMMMMMMMMMMNCFFVIVGCDWLDPTVSLDRSYNFTCVVHLCLFVRLYIYLYIRLFLHSFVCFFLYSFVHSLVKSFPQSRLISFFSFFFAWS